MEPEERVEDLLFSSDPESRPADTGLVAMLLTLASAGVDIDDTAVVNKPLLSIPGMENV